mmetsp:Transcript_19190/g.35508  ORF Transcript_19190/g.35508 Transcript_19190/m.35508 type:complete len:431 (-) Transcript_19190:29-1321(-)
MGLLDLASLGLFVLLLWRLREQYVTSQQMSPKVARVPGENVRADRSRSEPAVLKSAEQAQEPLEAMLEQIRTQSQGTVAIFVLLLLCLLGSVFLGQGHGNPMPGAPVDFETRVLWVELKSAEDVDRTVAELAPHHDFCVGLLDMQSRPEGEVSVTRIARSFVKAIALNKALRGAALLTFNNEGMYSAQHAELDTIVDQYEHSVPFELKSMHGFGTEKEEQKLRLSLAKCFGDPSNCPRVVEGGSVPSDILVNKHIQTNIQQHVAKTEFHCQCPEPVCAELPSQGASSAVAGATQLAAGKTSSKEAPQAEQEQVETVPSPASTSWFKLFIIWLTRLFGFVYPFHQTYVSLRDQEERAGEWRAYWTLYAMLHFFEDLIFVRLIYLLPVYIAAKVLFIGWCIFPDIKNSLDIYNTFVHTVNSVLENPTKPKRE